MVTPELGARSRREQVNLVLQPESSLARRLRDAENETGQSRTQIVREIVEIFLDTWKRAEMAKRSLLAVPTAPTTPVVLPLKRLAPRIRRGYVPEPGLAEAVAARRPMPEREGGPPILAERGQPVRLTPRSRPWQVPSVVDDEG